MDNYYRDKYNLDNYYTSNKTEKSTPSKGRRYAKKEKPTPKKTDSKKKNIRRSKLVFWLPISALLIVIFVTVGIVFFGHKPDTTFRFSQNVSISGIDISGLTYKEASKKVNSLAKDAVEDFTLTVVARDVTETYDKDAFQYNFYTKKALKQAKKYSLDQQSETRPTDFTELENADFELEYQVKNETVTKKVTSIAKKVNKNSANARVTKFKPFAENRFTYQEAETGYELVQSELTSEITQFINSKKASGEINATVNELEPSITVDDLKEKIVGISTASSVSYNNANGNTNMRVALEACNGSVIEPGELWSFNECTGDSNLESNGYKPATVISNKKLTEGVGGGLCQASSTIFRAAVFANMGVYERHNHYWASSYAYAGVDATIDYPNLDLKLRNTTEYQMFMECKMDGTTLIVNIYGYQEPHYDNVKIYSVNHDIVKNKSYKTTTYRVLYLDHEIVKEEVLCNSTYSLDDGASVRSADEGSFRIMVDGSYQIEAEPETEPPTTEPKATEKETEEPTEKQTKPTKPKETKPTQKPNKKPTQTTEAKPTEEASTEASEFE